MSSTFLMLEISMYVQNLNDMRVVSSGRMPAATLSRLTRVSLYLLKLLMTYSSWFVMGALKKKER